MGRKLIYELRGNAVISSGVAQGVSFILVFFSFVFVKFIDLAYTSVFLPGLTDHLGGLGSCICSC